MKIAKKIACVTLASALLVAIADGQQPSTPNAAGEPQAPCSNQVRSTYLLGPNDELDISGVEPEETAPRTSRIDGAGYLQVPLVGRVRVAGMTVQQSEQELNKRLSTYVRDPQVAINVKELRSQPVSILGAVNAPGVHQLQGQKTLLEMLSLAGGFRPDVGYTIRITRQRDWGCLPLSNARLDASGQFIVGEVKLKEIIEARNPAENIQILPNDVISVPKAEMVYVIGDVRRSGGFVLGERESMSVLQALSMAEGLERTADARRAKVLRLSTSGERREEIAVDVKRILKGKAQDVALQGGDILFIPGSTGKRAALRAIEAAIQTGTGLAIWRR